MVVDVINARRRAFRSLASWGFACWREVTYPFLLCVPLFSGRSYPTSAPKYVFSVRLLVGIAWICHTERALFCCCSKLGARSARSRMRSANIWSGPRNYRDDWNSMRRHALSGCWKPRAALSLRRPQRGPVRGALQGKGSLSRRIVLS